MRARNTRDDCKIQWKSEEICFECNGNKSCERESFSQPSPSSSSSDGSVWSAKFYIEINCKNEEGKCNHMAGAYEDGNLHACRQINASEHENKQPANEKCCNAICMHYTRGKKPKSGNKYFTSGRKRRIGGRRSTLPAPSWECKFMSIFTARLTPLSHVELLIIYASSPPIFIGKMVERSVNLFNKIWKLNPFCLHAGVPLVIMDLMMPTWVWSQT